MAAEYPHFSLDGLRELIALSSDGGLPLGRTDLFYRKLVPKNRRENVEWRMRVMDVGYENEDMAEMLWIMCARDPLFYFNTFVMTLDPLRHADRALRPFITWQYQDEAFETLLDAIGKEDVAIPKTRDMGASWMCLLALEWRWHFFGQQHFLLASAKEELVDSPSEKALFRKLDLVWKRLPCWLKPRMNRTAMACRNLDNDSIFTGEATVERLATGDRVTAMLLDEFGHMPGASKIAKSTRDVTKCRLFNSTPNGKAGTGEEFYKQCLNKNRTKLFLHWSRHPMKNRGLYKLDSDGNKVRLDPQKYDWKDDYDFDSLQFKRGQEPRSEWYDVECQRETNPKAIAQELDIDFLGSTERFMDTVALSVAKAKCSAPEHLGMLEVDPEKATGVWQAGGFREFQVWCPLETVSKQIDGEDVEFLQPVKGDYCAGVDISGGLGNENSSESAIVVWNINTREQVALWATTRQVPEQWALICVAVCRWFHDAFMVPEINGPGGRFMRKVQDTRYWNVYRRKVKMVASERVTEKLGYANTEGPEEMLGPLGKAIGSGACKLNSERIISQCLEYTVKAGRVVHTRAESSDVEADKGKLHGDCAIAAGAGWIGVLESPKRIAKRPSVADPDPSSLAWRLSQEKKYAKEAEASSFEYGPSDF